ncbi:type IV pilus biogenesis protein PilP [Yersinia kristensenii]|uniref:Type IV pilus biogenesis protein PilP n=2 Tax=Yersinia kristensenii TaxID=28152 RepID=A0A0T9L0W5_YERKR|nr:type IV pilus biogenesis protein PilP [Yersinia kristensenii]
MNNHRNRQWTIGGLLMMALPALAVGAEPLLAEVGRNPFERISTGSCDDDREKLADWQLQGIVLGADYHTAWVQRAAGQWQKLAIETHLLPHWQVTHISGRQVSLQHVNPEKTCSGSSGSVVLSMR